MGGLREPKEVVTAYVKGRELSLLSRAPRYAGDSQGEMWRWMLNLEGVLAVLSRPTDMGKSR